MQLDVGSAAPHDALRQQQLMSDLWHGMSPAQKDPFHHLVSGRHKACSAQSLYHPLLDLTLHQSSSNQIPSSQARKDLERYDKECREYQQRMDDIGLMTPLNMHVSSPVQGSPHSSSYGIHQHMPVSHPVRDNRKAFPNSQRLPITLGIPVAGPVHSHLYGGGAGRGSSSLPEMMPASPHSGRNGRLSLLAPNMSPEELEHLCHYTEGINSLHGFEHHPMHPGFLSPGGGHGGAGGHASGHPADLMDHELLNDHNEFEACMQSFANSEGPGAAIDLFGSSALVHLENSNVKSEMPSVAEHQQQAAETPAGFTQPVVKESLVADKPYFEAIKGSSLALQHNEQPHASSSAGSPSEVHVQPNAFGTPTAGSAGGSYPSHHDSPFAPPSSV
jgi:hypothetical protein